MCSTTRKPSRESRAYWTYCDWHDGPNGLPILHGAAAWFTARVLSRFDLADHVGYLTEPTADWAPRSLSNLVSFADVKDLEPGHEA